MPVGIMMCLARVLGCDGDGAQDPADTGAMKPSTLSRTGVQSQGFQGNLPDLGMEDRAGGRKRCCQKPPLNRCYRFTDGAALWQNHSRARHPAG